MDSYSMYMEIYRYTEGHADDIEAIIRMTENLIGCIANELQRPPYVLSNSTFVAYVLKTLPKNTERSVPGIMSVPQIVSVNLDAYAIILDTEKYIRYKSAGGLHKFYINKHQLFSGRNIDGVSMSLYSSLKNIKAYLDSLRDKASTPPNFSLPRAVVPKPEIRTQPPFSAGANLQRTALPRTEPLRIDTPQRTESPKIDTPQKTDSAKLEAQQKIEQQRAERESIRRRLEENRRSIQEWHESQKAIAEEIAKIQPDISRVLKGFMSFSDKVTEDYVMQFAKMYIALFNLISDSLDSQRKKAERSGNNDYINAVMNYEDFCGMIIDDLSAFGVDEIKTNPGEKFDGKIHEAVNTSHFTASLATVTENVRSGFMYNGIVIQKEKVNI